MEVYIHTKNTLKNTIIKTIIGLIPLFIYCLYKNGILLYNKDIMNLIGIFKVLYLVLIGLFIYTIINIIFKNKLKLDYEFLSIIIIPMFMPISIKYSLYVLGLTIGLTITKFFNINKVAVTSIIILGLCYLTKTLEFENYLELQNIYAFSPLDLLWGRNIGGLASTSILLGLALLVYLSITTNYKYEITIAGLIGFGLGIIVFKDYSLLYNSMAIMSLILVAPFMPSSPVLKIPKVIYGFLIGVLGFLLTKYLCFYEGMLISILIINIIYYLITKLTKKII